MEYYFESVDKKKNRKRFYKIILQPTIGNKLYLLRRWGRIGTKGKAYAPQLLASDEAEKELKNLVCTREKHGYNLLRSDRISNSV